MSVSLSLTDYKGKSIAEGKLAQNSNSDSRDVHNLTLRQNPANYNCYSFSVHEHNYLKSGFHSRKHGCEF